MTPVLVFILLFVGIFLFLLEIFLLPGFIVGALGIVICIYASVEAFILFGTNTGLLIVGGTILLNAVIAYVGLKNLHKSPMALKGVVDGKVNEFSPHGLISGEKGETVTALRPEGKARFGEEILTVWSFNGMIDAGKQVEIYKIDDSKIFVQTTKLIS